MRKIYLRRYTASLMLTVPDASASPQNAQLPVDAPRKAKQLLCTGTQGELGRNPKLSLIVSQNMGGSCMLPFADKSGARQSTQSPPLLPKISVQVIVMIGAGEQADIALPPVPKATIECDKTGTDPTFPMELPVLAWFPKNVQFVIVAFDAL